MDIGFLTTGLLTGLREGVEAALIVSLILAYLAKTGNRRHFGRIWAGSGAAVALSVAVGVILFATIRGLEEPAEQIFEGIATLLAVMVVTWMLFWMRRTSANIRGELQAGVDRALMEGGIWGLSILAFTAVIREGIETSLFLLGQVTAASSAEDGAVSTLVGAVVGLILALLIGYGFYRGARVINLATFFRWTGVALVFIAAGLLAYSVHEFVEAGWITVATGTAFDISGILPHSGDPVQLGPVVVFGQLLRALFGYSSTPEWVTLIAWLAYVVAVLTLYLRPMKPVASHPISEGRPAVNA
ncbi:MAG TPA: iron uptake transporter permease EfeU [Candidatus Limnocylindrales bacterium]|nr:iron uptake transporter permease EfeU [Candidatus Limnocylindrales bacterium]